MTMNQTKLNRLKRIESTQNSERLDPQTAVLFEPIFAVIAYHCFADEGARCNLVDDDATPLPQTDMKDISMLPDAELRRHVLHGYAPDLDKMFVAAGAEPRNGRELNAWIKSPATMGALEAVYDSIPATIKRQERLPDTLSDYLEQAKTSAAKVDIGTILVELEQARALALANKQSSAAVAASMAKAKVAGLIVDKQENQLPGANGGPISTGSKQQRDAAVQAALRADT